MSTDKSLLQDPLRTALHGQLYASKPGQADLSETSFGKVEPQKSSKPDSSSLGNEATGTENYIVMPATYCS
jgi:hypothetical protein